MKQKQIQARINKLLGKAKVRNRKCYWNGCQNNAINSHILQKNGILTKISTNGHIIISKTDFLNPELFYFKRSGINNTYTFKGFCKDHDNSIFQPIEDYEIDFNNYRNQLLFAYRTILNEKRTKEVLIDWNNSQVNNPILSNLIDKTKISKLNNQYRIAINDIKYYENIILSNLKSIEEDFVFKVRYIKELDVCLASHFTFETTRERKEHIKKTGDDFKLLTNIFISLFPLIDESVFIMGYLKSMHKKCGAFVESFFVIEESNLLLEISNLMLRRCEQWACSDQFYQKHIKERETEINKIFRESATSIDEDEKLDFNIFD